MMTGKLRAKPVMERNLPGCEQLLPNVILINLLITSFNEKDYSE
jgi:hypothetical protein